MKNGSNGEIIMESRYSDIEPLIEILDEWIDDHPNDDKKEVAEKLHNILDVMFISW